ncbi:hypothetical protein BJ973_001671 [Actinoplanes tereljensis]|uniref:DUF4304 domain-containing protein n=1 Tax=Paractinoplanes tereljensis TaxID=571912 RepID=A0A919NKI6_9ACTN|nr:hypothetical protein [Actinoplanes tereljensis]GIF20425.1 hypothetical protein Ate02nite_31550 [Actinoplanes tereljensis]
MAGAVLKTCARLLGAHLRQFGFEADGLVFRRYNSGGDVVIVELQPHRSFLGDTQFFVNLAFLLEPIWRHDGYPPGTRPDSSHGSWWERVNPADWVDGEDFVEQWVVADRAACATVTARLVARLGERLPVVLGWLDRDKLRQAVADGVPVGYETELWLLAEDGPSEELRAELFGSGSPDDAGVADVDRAIWAYAHRAGR